MTRRRGKFTVWRTRSDGVKQRYHVGTSSTVEEKPVLPQIGTEEVLEGQRGLISLEEMYNRFEVQKLADDVHPQDEQMRPDAEFGGPIPGATGGYLSRNSRGEHVPERLFINGRTITPDDSMWHHLVFDSNDEIIISKERVQLYQSIAHAVLKDGKSSKNPEYIFMGGGPAAGKSTLLKAGIVPMREGTVRLEADQIKTMLPEFDDLTAETDTDLVKSAGVFTHDESSFIIFELQQIALDRKYPIILDGCAAGSPEKMQAKVVGIKRRGYATVKAVYATVPTETAVHRAERRFQKEKRWIRPEDVEELHESVSDLVPAAADRQIFDSLVLVQTDTAGPPRIVMSTSRTKETVVHHPDAWGAFLSKSPRYEKPAVSVHRPTRPRLKVPA